MENYRTGPVLRTVATVEIIAAAVLLIDGTKLFQRL